MCIRDRLNLENGKRYGQTGTLKFSDPTVDETTGSVTLRAIFPNPNGDLLPGMYVTALDVYKRQHSSYRPLSQQLVSPER